MPFQIYSVTGRVVDRNTSEGISNLRIEAWDLHHDHQGSFGSANADENGRFILCLNLGDSGQESRPDLYFKVYLDTELIADTENSVVLIAGEVNDVLIEVNITKPPAEGKDRLNARQVFTGVDFLSKSDFKGLFTETKRKAGTRVNFVTDMIMNTVKKSELKPVRVGNTKEQDVINQPVDEAKLKLTREKIEVNQVLPYSPALNKASLNNFAGAPPRLKEGQKVNLYVKDDKVMYYSLVREQASNNANLAEITKANTEEFARIENELSAARENAIKKDAAISVSTQEHREQLIKLQEELNVTKQNAAIKEAEISQLTSEHREQLKQLQEELKTSKETAAKKDLEFNKLSEDLKALRDDQTGILNIMRSENFKKLLKDVQKKGPAKPPVG